ncbi:GMP synthase (glutamine-hydrolysing) [Rhodoblastus acidophilus]|uniref:GMP synthase (Glutamine-hydrolysing) n=1 Tax=Rhodoblastus acidophilus TaxID=1074 RepID=A0A212RXG8_RHOAC|nr:glutamine amidotransferase [Rhodoblastus acidophilus]PPQ38426.1 glutamine amidotransferase [Rhodoblastus acidophilus]RAI17268.1 glutamine amidotransferase [Rhodoblastus acidophilus]SNB77421.1 GMP synthase (glutamine-hydrolysing) [Rhodoblastus acidophilus]
MKRALVLRHLAFEHLGTLAALLPAYGFEIAYHDVGLGPLPLAEIDACDLLVALGGPIGVYEVEDYPFLPEEIAAIGARLKAGKPTLGICLGGQMMAAALGAPVAPGPGKEIGYAPLTLAPVDNSPLAPLDGVHVLHWHGDAFGLPDGAVSLASTPLCPHQAFSLGKHALALQFHAEVEPEALESWLIGHTCELGKAGIKPGELRRQAAIHGAATAHAGTMMFRRWLDGIFA